MALVKISLDVLPKNNGEYIYYDIPKLKDELLIARKNNKFIVLSSFCPHFGGPLRFDKQDNLLKCYFHNYHFDSDIGNCINRKVKMSCLFYKFEITDKFLKVFIED